MIRRLAFLLLVLLTLSGCSTPADPPADDSSGLIAELDRVIPARMRATGIPGVAAALVRGGTLVWVGAYGMEDVEARRPMQPSSIFGVASISKTVTAWGVMRLVEAGKIDLDAPIRRYLSRWQIPASAYDPEGVTIRRLLSHSAGLNTPEYLGHLPGAAAPGIEAVLSGGDGRAPGLRLVEAPGSRFAYSDGGYLLLQLLIEEVSGEPFEIFMQREVLDGLGISDASFAPGSELLERLVTSYDVNGSPLPKYAYVEKAPAGLFITVQGLAQFAAAAMKGPNGLPPGRGVLKEESVNEMLAMQVEIHGFDRLIYAHGYGLGYYTETVGDGVRVVSHMGANLNGVTEFAAIPATGDAIVILTTGMAGQEVFADALQLWIRRLGYDAVTLPRAIQTARAGMFGLAGLLCGLALYATLQIGTGLWRSAGRTAVRTADIKVRSRRRTGLYLILPPILAVVFLAGIYPYLKISMPSAAPWIATGWVWLCLTGPAGVISAWAVGRSSAGR